MYEALKCLHFLGNLTELWGSCTWEDTCSPANSQLYQLGISQAQKAKESGDDPCHNTLHDVCPHLSFPS